MRPFQRFLFFALACWPAIAADLGQLADSSDAEVTLSEIQRQKGANPRFGVYSNSRVAAAKRSLCACSAP